MRVTRSLFVGGATLIALVLTRASVQSQQQPAPASSIQAAAAAVTLPRGNLEHGRYIVEHVAMCVECHSGRDDHGSIVESERFIGAPIPFGPSWSKDWAMRAPRNKGLPGYTDASALRLLTQGAIGRNGEHLRAPMPRFRMNVQDAADVIAYMRSL